MIETNGSLTATPAVESQKLLPLTATKVASEHPLRQWKRLRSISVTGDRARSQSAASADSIVIMPQDKPVVINIRDSVHAASDDVHAAASQPVEETCGISGMSTTCCIILVVQVFFAVMVAGSFLLYTHEYDPWVDPDEHLSEHFKREVEATAKSGNVFATAKLSHWEMFRFPAENQGRYKPAEHIWDLPGDDFKKTGFHKSVIKQLSAWESDKSEDKPTGITIDPFTGEKPTTGIMVAIDACQILKNYKDLNTVKKWIQHHRQVLVRKDRYLGAWISQETGKAVIEISTRLPCGDATRLDDLETAKRLGLMFQQEGVYELPEIGGIYHNIGGNDNLKNSARECPGIKGETFWDWDCDGKPGGCFGRLFSWLPGCGRKK